MESGDIAGASSSEEIGSDTKLASPSINTSSDSLKKSNRWERFKIALYEKYLAEGVSISNFFCFLFLVMMSISFYVFLNLVRGNGCKIL